MQNWQYILVFMGLIWVVFRFRKQSGQRKAISRRVLIRYLDGDPDFEAIFPLAGTVARTLQINSTSFFVIELDKPFAYEGQNFEMIAVREKSVGKSIGHDADTEVHVLLPKVPLNKPRYVFEDFVQVCWATVSPEY